MFNLLKVNINIYKGESNQILYDASTPFFEKFNEFISNDFSYINPSTKKVKQIAKFSKRLKITFIYSDLLIENLENLNDDYVGTAVFNQNPALITFIFKSSNDLINLVDSYGNRLFDRKILDLGFVFENNFLINKFDEPFEKNNDINYLYDNYNDSKEIKKVKVNDLNNLELN